MKGRPILISVLALGLILALTAGLNLAQAPRPQGEVNIQAAPVGTAFTYQGRLTDGGSPANGSYDFQFKLYDAASGGTQVGSTVTKEDVAVSDGLFTVELDFGTGVFTGDARHLEIGVRPGSSTSAYTTLMPRQTLTPTPYALALPGLWTQQNTTSPNLIGGYSGNSVTSGVAGATIGGGGAADDGWGNPMPNRVTDDYGTVSGGGDNQAGDNAGTTGDARYATVGGGVYNTASGWAATVGGGSGDRALAVNATVGGGSGNTASGGFSTVSGGSSNTASGFDATVDGGRENMASGHSSTVGGGFGNTASESSSTVGGGSCNTASGRWAAVGGGRYNTASGNYATVSGGGLSDPSDLATGNRVTDDYSTVGGGGNNQAGDADGDTTNAPYATVGGGLSNTASGFAATVGGGNWNAASDSSIVGGGSYNTASGSSSTVGGGSYNTASDQYATVGGGGSNKASNSYTTAGGGWNNRASGLSATVSGGEWNTASGGWATVGGGGNNSASGSNATVGGGMSNRASGYHATVSGGGGNEASGEFATVPGGSTNAAQGDYSFAAGRRAKANHDGAFVWADSTDADLASTGDDQFLVRASGGVYFYTSSDLSTGAYLAAGSSSWAPIPSPSDRNLKENFAPVDGQEVLARLAEIPITTWNYKAQNPAIRHLGPVAQDFYAAFGVGEDDHHISTVDANGVALAAAQGLYQALQEKEAQIAAQQQRIDDLEARVGALEQAVGAPRSSQSNLPGVWLLMGGLVVVAGLVVQRRHPGGGR